MNPVDERAALLQARVRRWQEDGWIAPETADRITAAIPARGKFHGVVVQVVFFVLTAVALLAFVAFLHVIRAPVPGLVAGATALAAGEWLIRVRRWYATGVEAALWLGGLIAAITELPRSGEPESLLVIAAAAAIAAVRVRNPLFGVLAAGLVSGWAEERLDAGVLAALVFAGAGVAGVCRSWRRPSTEWFFGGLALIMPVVGRMFAGAEWRVTTILLYGAFGAAALVAGLRIRHHAPLLGGLAGVAIAAVDTFDRTRLAPEWQLAMGGALLLALSMTVSRVLRNRREGVVAVPAKLTRLDDALEIGGAVVATQASAAEPPADGPRGDGRFGGAGATGDY